MNLVSTVNIILVTYNGEEYIEKCIDSLKKQNYPKNKYTITVIDNASKDTTIELLGRFQEITVIKNHENLGFAKANNIALKNEEFDYAILLNQDSFVEPDFIEKLVRVMESDSSIGICGSAEHPPDQTLQSDRKTEETTWVGLGATIIRMTALKQINFLDDNYFMYNEDIDLCWRLKLHGWKVYYTPNAHWHHYGWERTITQTDPRVINSSVSRLYLLLKFASFRQVCTSLRLYLTHKQNKVLQKPQGMHHTKRPSPSPLKKSITVLKILMRTLPKIPFAFLQRYTLRSSPLFNQAHADALIRESDQQIYTR